MARIFITGSADGLGKLSAKLLIEHGHKVVLHARNTERGHDAIKENPGAETVLTGDLSNIEKTKALADQINSLGTFDSVIHNAGVYQSSAKQILAVNTLAPYILTCLVHKPKRLIYLSSTMHLQGNFNPDNFNSDMNQITYSDSKFHVLLLCMAVARKWPQVYANAVNPGWVPTKMGGKGAPDNLEQGYATQAWLAVSNDEKAKVSGHYFFHKKERQYKPDADNILLQQRFLDFCNDITGVSFPQ